MKEKISITLDENIVRKIEKLAEKQNINRSKFIENVLMESLERTPVLILAGWSELRKEPKSLLSFNGKRLIVRQIEMLYQWGFRNIYVSASSEDLKEYVEKNFPEVHVLFETQMLGSGGTLKSFAGLVQKRFLFLYCDILFELNLNQLLEFHIQNKSALTLVLKSTKNPSKYGTARMEGNRIIGFEEKPKSSEIYLAYIGIGIAEPEALKHLEDHGKFEIQLDKIPDKTGYIYEGFWRSFEKEKDINS